MTASIDEKTQARLLIQSYRPELTIKALYDDDEDLRGALAKLIAGFEYPDWSHKTIGQVAAQLGPVYVLMVVLDPGASRVLGLQKLKGPAHLIGKMTFPGGRIEPRENFRTTATRELQEETGVKVPAVRWRLISMRGDLVVVAAQADLTGARTQEAEPVVVMPVDSAQRTAIAHPGLYAADFLTILESAKEALTA